MGKADKPPLDFLMTYPDTLAAQNTFIRVVNVKGAAGVYGQVSGYSPETVCPELESKVSGYPLKFAGAVPGTGTAISPATGEYQFESGADNPVYTRASGINYHALLDRLGAGSHQFITACDLYKAQATGSKRLLKFTKGAKMGDIDVIIEGSPEDLLPFWGFNLLAING